MKNTEARRENQPGNVIQFPQARASWQPPYYERTQLAFEHLSRGGQCVGPITAKWFGGYADDVADILTICRIHHGRQQLLKPKPCPVQLDLFRAMTPSP